MVHIYNGMLLAINRSESESDLEWWMNLESIIQSKVSLSHFTLTFLTFLSFRKRKINIVY